MKKWIAPFLILALAVLLIACGKEITEKILEKNANKGDLAANTYMSAAIRPEAAFPTDFQNFNYHKNKNI